MQFSFIIYTCDEHHSQGSMDKIAIATSIEKVLELCEEQRKKDGKKLSSESRSQLALMKQTQGQSEYEFFIECYDEKDINRLW